MKNPQKSIKKHTKILMDEKAKDIIKNKYKRPVNTWRGKKGCSICPKAQEMRIEIRSEVKMP